MEIKKNPEVDFSRNRTMLMLAGLALALAFVWGLLEYRQYDQKQSAMIEDDWFEEDIEVEQTVQEPEPEEPPPSPPKLEVVEDDIELEEQPEIEETEDDEDDIIAPPPVIKDDIDNSNEVFESWDVSQKAQFKGGQDEMLSFIAKNLVYPEIARMEGIQGRVMVEFVVNSDGTIDKNTIKILGRKIGFGCDEEAIKVVHKMSGMWSPAQQRDRNVRQKFRIPIRFQIQ